MALRIIINIFLLVLHVNKSICSSNIYIKGVNNKGEFITLLTLNTIKSKEVFVGPKEGSEEGIVLRQISNGKQIVSMIFNGIPQNFLEAEGISANGTSSLLQEQGADLVLKRCEVEKSPAELGQFIQSLQDTIIEFMSDRVTHPGGETRANSSFEVLKEFEDSTDLPSQVAVLTKFNEHKKQCFDFRRLLRKKIRRDKHKNRQQYGLNSRRKRGVTNLLRMPNTMWCGAGNGARSYRDLGGLQNADMCCRQHDMHCPYYIESFSKKYGHFNFGLTTLSHCSCDRRFQACLKHVGTGAADVVGKVFFNLLKTPCFIFEKKRICRKGSYWKCHKYGYRKRAVIKETKPWK